MQEDLYEIIGVSRDATADEIKRAFRRKAMECHPDRNQDDPTAEESFKRLNEAYRVLCDPQERAYYDRTGRTNQRQNSSDPFGFGGNPSEIFEELFSQFFGGGFRGSKTGDQKGNDVRLNIRISFDDSAKGTQARIRVPRKETCPECGGSGAGPGTGSETCPVCNGKGRTEFNQGFISFTRTCKRCSGAGRVIRRKCSNCAGAGLVSCERELTVKVPAGIRDGSSLKLAGEGESGRRGGASGDLFVLVNVDAHPRFTRRDDDLVIEVPLSFAQAALGADINVPTLEGTEKIRIPPGTQTGRVFRLRSLGMPRLGGAGRGDLHCVVHIDVPVKLTEEQKELLRQFARLSGEEVDPKSRGFFDKVKDIFG